MLLQLWGGNMGIYIAGMIVVAAAALVAGTFLGWRLGMHRQAKVQSSDALIGEALRVNASFDFNKIRGKADQITKLANEIASAAKTAQETVHKSFAPYSDGGEAGQSTAFDPGEHEPHT